MCIQPSLVPKLKGYPSTSEDIRNWRGHFCHSHDGAFVKFSTVFKYLGVLL